MKVISLSLLALGVCSSVASAAVIGTGYTQNFNGMGTGTSFPSGWAGYSISGSHDQFKPADDPSGTGALPTGNDIKAGTAITKITAATAGTQKSSTTLYNWAVGGSSTDRALGTSPTGVAGLVLELSLTNDQSVAITDLVIAYDVQVLSTTSNNNSYSANNYVGIEELPGYRLFYSLDGGNTYTNVSVLNTDGHTWANAVGTVHEEVGDVALSSAWTPGSTLLLRWFDDNAQGPSPDQLLGLDNVVITPVVVPEPATLVLLGLSGIIAVNSRRKA